MVEINQGAAVSDIVVNGSPVEPLLSEKAELLAKLEARIKAAGAHKGKLPNHLRVDQIELMPALFQPREGIREDHVGNLTVAVRSQGKVDPVEVLPVGDGYVLIDGHHRMEAYKRALVDKAIPVKCFEGTAAQAVLRSGEENTKAKLFMMTSEKSDAAWQYVLMGCYTKAQIVNTGLVAEGTVATMRRAIKTLGDDAGRCKTWREASHMARGDDGPTLSHDEREAQIQKQVKEWAGRMSDTFGTKLSNNPDLAARVFEIYFGNNFGQLANELEDYRTDSTGKPVHEF